MTLKERKIYAYMSRAKYFNSICPEGGLDWGKGKVLPISMGTLKQDLLKLEEKDIDRKGKSLETFIKAIEKNPLSERGTVLPEIKDYVKKYGRIDIRFNDHIRVVVNGIERTVFVSLHRITGTWYLKDRRGKKYLLRQQEFLLQREVFYRIKAKYDPSINPNKKTRFRAYL